MGISGLRCIIVGSNYHFLCLACIRYCSVTLDLKGRNVVAPLAGARLPAHQMIMDRPLEASTLQRNHKNIEFGASIMSCEYLAGLGEKSMAIVESLRV